MEESLIEEFSLEHSHQPWVYYLVANAVVRNCVVWLLIKFILLDEPFAGVDPVAVEDIQRIVFKKKNIGILITTTTQKPLLLLTKPT
jgi:lipopolysaccharide export system ATP-binding protein